MATAPGTAQPIDLPKSIFLPKPGKPVSRREQLKEAIKEWNLLLKDCRVSFKEVRLEMAIKTWGKEEEHWTISGKLFAEDNFPFGGSGWADPEKFSQYRVAKVRGDTFEDAAQQMLVGITRTSKELQDMIAEDQKWTIHMGQRVQLLTKKFVARYVFLMEELRSQEAVHELHKKEGGTWLDFNRLIFLEPGIKGTVVGHVPGRLIVEFDEVLYEETPKVRKLTVPTRLFDMKEFGFINNKEQGS